jgi:CheY-like chemotaxis protein
VLIVEDVDEFRRFLVRMLTGLGYSVLEARHGADALRVFHDAAQPIDIVLTDVAMPYVDGIELVARLRAEHDDVKVLFMSGHSKRSIGPIGMNDAYIRKPFTMGAMAAQLCGLLAAG